MPEAPAPPVLRRDPVTGEWVILAAGRSRRPHAPVPGEPAAGTQEPDCPFCEGREQETPPEVCACRDGDGCDCPGWKVRVFPNKYPILANRLPEEEAAGGGERPAYGYHEVIVDSPFHNLAPWQVGPGQTCLMLETYRDRIREYRDRDPLRYVLVMRNHKAAGAASLDHPHSQLFALPFVPPVVDAELAGFERHVSREGACVLCEMIASEEREHVRVVAASENFVAFCPYASRVPFETWLVPRAHQPRFEDNESLEEAAELLADVLMRLRNELGDPPFNYWLHTYPLRGEFRPYHWQLEIRPRITVPGGLELGAGVAVNTVPPEEAAAALRGAPGWMPARSRQDPPRRS